MVEFEKLKAMMEKVNAAFAPPDEPYRIESLEKTKGEIAALCGMIEAFDGP
jgi:hypothetical protein